MITMNDQRSLFSFPQMYRAHQRLSASVSAVPVPLLHASSPSSILLDGFSSSAPSQQFLLCRADDIRWSPTENSFGADQGMAEVLVGAVGPSRQRVLLVRLGTAVDELFALSPDCPNCQSPLIRGILCKNRIRCCIHGTAFNIRTGLLEDGVGLNSIWSSRVRLAGSYLFTDVHPHKLSTLRTLPYRRPLVSLSSKQQGLPIVVVGAGIAGVTCVETLRQLNHAGPIVLISKEAELPYDRKSLSKRQCDPYNPDDNRMLRSLEFFEHQLGIDLWLGCTVKSIRTDQKCILVEGLKDDRDVSDRSISSASASTNSPVRVVRYSELVLALGATNRRLHGVQGAERLEGILYVRTLEDGRRLGKEVRGRNVAIIGSGFLGFELASLISPVAKSVAIYGKAAHPLTIFGSTIGREIRNYMHEEGVTVRQDTVLRSLDGFDRVQQLTFRDGLTVVADVVVVAIGIMPSTSVLMGSGIRTDGEGFVLVDERMRTNVAGVYACGDCTKFPIGNTDHPTATTATVPTPNRRRVNLPHWQIAQHQARTVAYTIVGIDYVPRLVPFIWTRLFDRHLTFSGDPSLEPDERIARGSLAANDYVVYSLRRERVIGVISCGPANVAVQFIELFRKGRLISKEQVLRNERNQWQAWQEREN